MKKDHSEMSEKDILVETFLKYKFEYYNGHYPEKVPEYYMKNLDYSAAEKFFKRVYFNLNLSQFSECPLIIPIACK